METVFTPRPAVNPMSGFFFRKKRVEIGIQQPLFGGAADQAGAELTEYGEVETGVRQFQAEGVFPSDADADGVGRLPVRQDLDEPVGDVISITPGSNCTVRCCS